MKKKYAKKYPIKTIVGIVVVAIVVVAIASNVVPNDGTGLPASAIKSITDLQSKFCLNPFFTKLCHIHLGGGGNGGGNGGGLGGGGNGTLSIAGITLTQHATNENRPIVTKSTQTQYTDTMNLSVGGRTVTLGISSLAGGYIPYIKVKGSGVPSVDGQELINWGYGQGIQSTLRDLAHNLRYNPASVGFTGYRLGKQALGYGTPVDLTNLQDKSIQIHQSHVALYQGEGKGYDFTQYEDLAPDNNPNDGGNTDADHLPEVGLSQKDEITSEFDYTGEYQNVSSLFSIPAMQYDYAYAYIRPPKAILQFTDPRDVDQNGVPVYQDSKRVEDVSLTQPGNQTATSVDLSGMLPTWGIRLYPATFTQVMWKQGGVWQILPSSPKGAGRYKVATCQLRPDVPGYKDVAGGTSIYYFKGVDCTPDNDLVMNSTGSNPDTAFAVALFAPQDMMRNSEQVWTINSTNMQVISREDRRVQSMLINSGPGSDIRSNIAGLLSPTTLAAMGHPNEFEMVTQRAYLLFGTPNQIENAVTKYKQSAAYAAAAKE